MTRIDRLSLGQAAHPNPTASKIREIQVKTAETTLREATYSLKGA